VTTNGRKVLLGKKGLTREKWSGGKKHSGLYLGGRRGRKSSGGKMQGADPMDSTSRGGGTGKRWNLLGEGSTSTGLGGKPITSKTGQVECPHKRKTNPKTPL